jgi:hypothetical protein
MDLPERLLGVCESCKHWYLIDRVRDANEGVMVGLPDIEAVRGLALDNPPPSAGISATTCEPDETSPSPPTPADEPESAP